MNSSEEMFLKSYIVYMEWSVTSLFNYDKLRCLVRVHPDLLFKYVLISFLLFYLHAPQPA